MALTTVKSDQIQSSVALAGSPTTTTQSASDNSTKVATTAYVETAVANLVASAPAALNTLDELAAALNDDASFSTNVTNSIATKLPLAGGTMTGDIISQDNRGIKFGTGSDTSVYNDGSNFYIKNNTLNQDIIFQGNDDGSTGTTVLTLDMSNGGAATFNSTITATDAIFTTGLDIRVGTDKRVLWQGNIGEIGSVAGFQAVNTAGSANTDFGIRATTIRLATGSSEKVRVAAAGHLEFNPVNSFAALNNSILSSSNTYMYMMGGAAGLYLANNSGLDTSIGIRDAGYIDFNTGSSERMRIDSSGNVGITTANSNLGVGDDAYISGNYSTVNVRGTNGGQILMGRNSGANDWDFFAYTTNGATRIGVASGDVLAFHTNSAGSNNERMRIDSNGNVNIGAKAFITDHGATTDNLQVGYALNLYEDSYNSGTDNYVFLSNNAYYSSSGNKYMRSDEASRFYQNAGNFYFQNAPSGTAGNAITFTDRFFIKADGNVGIGNTSPGSALHITKGSGAGHNGIRIDNTTSYYGQLNFYTTGGNRRGFVQSAGDGDLEVGTDSSSGNIQLYSGGQIALEAANNTRNIGIGVTPDASYKVKVYSGDYYTMKLRAPTYPVLKFEAINQNSGNNGEIGISANNEMNINPNSSTYGISIQNTGAVRMRNQPYVQGRGNAGWSATAGSATWNRQPHNSTPVMSSNRGSSYSTTNKRFTCPVDGVYLVQASWYIYQTAAATAGSQYVHPGVFKNGSSNWNGGHQPYTIFGHEINRSGTGSKHYDGIQMSFTIYCSATDYLEIYLYAPNSNPQSYEYYHYFSYTLLN